MSSVVLLLENIGFVQEFTVVSGASAINLSGATVEWLLPRHTFVLSLVSAASGVIRYVQSDGDFGAPGSATGRLRVSYSATQRFYTDTFPVTITRAVPA
jgi:hypothetical protein